MRFKFIFSLFSIVGIVLQGIQSLAQAGDSTTHNGLGLRLSLLGSRGNSVTSNDVVFNAPNIQFSNSANFYEFNASPYYIPKTGFIVGLSCSYSIMSQSTNLNFNLPVLFGDATTSFPFLLKRERLGLGLFFGYQRSHWNASLRGFVTKTMKQKPDGDYDLIQSTYVVSTNSVSAIKESTEYFNIDPGFNDTYLCLELTRDIFKGLCVGAYLRVVNVRRQHGPKSIIAHYESYNLQNNDENYWKPYAQVEMREAKIGVGLMLGYKINWERK